MNYPKITIVTPNFNQERYLEETILSVLNQGYPNLEYIIMDGGSTDGSVEIIKKYQDSLAYWSSEKDGGMYDALNKGFQKSSGEIMGWINSDDFLHKNSLFLIAKMFNDQPAVNWVQGLPTVSDQNGTILFCRKYKQYSKLDFVFDLNNQDWIQQESTFWRKSLYAKAGNYIERKYKFAGDLDLWMRFFRHEKLYSVNALVGSFRLTQENISVLKKDDYKKEAESIIKNEVLNPEEKAVIARMKNEGIINKVKNIFNKPKREHMFGYPKPLHFNFNNVKFDI